MADFDPYEPYTPPTSASPRAARRGDRREDDADVIALPELPKHSTSSRGGFPDVQQQDTGYYPRPTQRTGKGRPPSLSLAPRHAQGSRGSSPASGSTLVYTSSSSPRSYLLKADDYSLPPTADSYRRLLDEDGKHETLFSGPSPVHPSRQPPSSRRGSRSLREENWWTRTFEPPDWKQLAFHTMLCLIAFPAISLILPLARGSIFWVRVYVSLGCSAFGLSIGFSLLTLVRKWLEAAAWATVIHQSVSEGEDGIRIRHMAIHTSDSSSAWVAIKLLWDRYTYFGTARQNRRSYDKRPWSLFIAFFLFCLFVGASMTFVLGRVVAIDTNTVYQRERYREVAIAGDLSDSDISAAAAQLDAFDDFVRTWTLAPFASSENQGRAVRMPYNGEDIYFAEATSAQLQKDGHGMGTFQFNGTVSSNSRKKRGFLSSVGGGTSGIEDGVGQILRYPKWGIRIHCDNLPDASLNIVPHSPNNQTYVFLPRSLVSGLFSSFGMDMPDYFNEYNATNKTLLAGDSFPNGSDPSSWAIGQRFTVNGVAHSFWSLPITMGASGTGWVYLETVLVRLNTSYVPRGNFPLYSEESMPDAQGRPTRIGYDAAVCLELYEPWIVDTYNATTGLPNTWGVVGRNNTVHNLSNNESRKGASLKNTQRTLNSTGRWSGFAIAHDNSVNQMVKDNGRDAYYVPSPTIVSFTDGSGPQGYTALSASHFAEARALADAANVLPFLAGTGMLVARAYDDETQAYVEVGTTPLLITLGVALVFGIAAAVLCPRLPLDVPRREFGLYSWLAVLQGDSLLRELRTNELERGMEVREVAQRVGDMKVRYVI